MLIRHKLNIVSIALCLVPAIVVGLVCTILTKQMGAEIYTEQLEGQLESVSSSKKNEIAFYLENIKRQIVTYSSNQMVVDAMGAFSAAYRSFRPAPNMRQSITDYYEQSFSPTYANNNLGKKPNVSRMVDLLDPESLYLQYHYISANQNALGEKHKLDNANDGSAYSRVHEYYHTHFRKFLETFGYYDIFLVDLKSGDVIYSVFKELDYTTSLKTGAFKDSGIAKAFRGAAQLQNPDDVYFTDFEPYTRSYEAAASFISSPIFKGNEKVGVLIFQMPVDQISNIMTSDKQWKSVGMGEYGESYLVGQNGKLVSEKRLALEDTAGYVKALEASGASSDIVQMVKARESGIGLHQVDNHAVSAALKGESGVLTRENYLNRTVLTGYSALDFEGARWAVVTDVDKTEMYAGLENLTGFLNKLALMVGVVAAIAGAIVGRMFAANLVAPINAVAQNMREIYEGDGDLTKRLPVNGDDEIAQLSQNFNGFAEKVRMTVASFVQALGDLNGVVSDLGAVRSRSNGLVEQQNQQSSMISTAITEMAASVQEVAGNAERVAAASGKSSADTQEANAIFDSTIAEIHGNTNKIEEAAAVINRLQEETNQIGSVLDVIRGIAEQTNLLALNAAIEAARAGEQGRGFAVVADEVRTLASRTQASTQEIEEMISRLQVGAGDAVAVMAESQKSGQSSIEKGKKASATINDTATAIDQISNMMIQVATATEEQATVAEDINANIVSISDLSSQITDEFRQLNGSVDSITQCADTLAASARAFRV